MSDHNTAATSSVEDEKDPDFHPGSPAEVAEKLEEETENEPGVAGKAKRVLEELDRQVGGEYERREDPDSQPSEEDAGDESGSDR